MRILLYYKYVTVPDPESEAVVHRTLCKELGLRGRVLIGTEGINGTCSGTAEACEAYKHAMKIHPLFQGMSFKESDHPTHAFSKLFVRVRPEIVTLGDKASAECAAPYVTPEELHEELERGEDLVLIDMRNDYEAVIGKFKNAVVLPITAFREIPENLSLLKPYQHRRVVTYCTGGIRCERASALLKEHGFTDVRQLEGGIVRYLEAYPDGHFLGSLFVFDDRRCVRFPGKKPYRFISSCAYCSVPSDRYLNCRDDLCHGMFICCETCEQQVHGYCQNPKHALEAAYTRR